jgi:RHS repeat-associated protein
MSEENRQLYYYHGDHLGSAQLVTDPEGKIYEQLEYTPYGELWVEHNVPVVEATPFRFTGKERDGETGLYYFGARYLNPQTGMWLSADPAMGEYIPQAPINDEAKQYNKELPGMGGVFNYVNLHAYHYAGNNPVKYTDPDGRDIFLFGFTVGAGAGTGGTNTAGFYLCIPDDITQTTIGTFEMFEFGAQFGVSAGIGGTFTWAPFATSTDDIRGYSNTLGGSINLGLVGKLLGMVLPDILSLGAEGGMNPTAKGFEGKLKSITLSFSLMVTPQKTTPVEGHLFTAETFLAKVKTLEK